MSQLIQRFYENVVPICQAGKEVELVEYLTSDGSKILQEFLHTDLQNSTNDIECRDFAIFLIELIDICYKNGNDAEARQALSELSSIETIFDEIELKKCSTEKNVFSTIDLILENIFLLVKSRSNFPSSQMKTEIINGFLGRRLVEFADSPKEIFIYQKTIRTTLKIFRSMFVESKKKFSKLVEKNPFDVWLKEIFRETSKKNESPSDFLSSLSFDILFGFLALVNETIVPSSKLVDAMLNNDFFPLLNVFSTSRKSSFLVLATKFLRIWKTFLSKKSDGKFSKTKVDSICKFGAVFDKFFDFVVFQFDQKIFDENEFFRGALKLFNSVGPCCCFPLSKLVLFLSKIDASNEQIRNETIRFIRRVFLEIFRVKKGNFHQNFVTEPAERRIFWQFLCRSIFQRCESEFALQLGRTMPELIQLCSNEEKQNAFRVFILPTLDFFLENREAKPTIVEYFLQTTTNLLFDTDFDFQIDALPDKFIGLTDRFPTFLFRILPILGLLATKNKISENFIGFVVKLVNNDGIEDDALDNLCHLLIILIPKNANFRSSFYGKLSHLKLKEKFDDSMRNSSNVPTSLIGAVLLAVSFYDRPNDEKFNYPKIVERLAEFSRSEKANRIWFENLVRLGLSEKYREKQTRWKSSTMPKTMFNENYQIESERKIFEEEKEFYSADDESSSDFGSSKENESEENRRAESNLIVFPELLFLVLQIVWENVDRHWSSENGEQICPKKISNFVIFVESILNLVRTNFYNRSILKRFHFDEFLFHCLLTIDRRAPFDSKQSLINLIINFLEKILSLSMSVTQIGEIFKTMLKNEDLAAPLTRLLKNLIDQIDPHESRCFCSMPLDWFARSKNAVLPRFSLEQILSLNEKKSTEENRPIFDSPQKVSFVTKSLKKISFEFPLSIGFWLKTNFPFDRKEIRCALHVFSLFNDSISAEFWLDETGKLVFRLVSFVEKTDKTFRLTEIRRDFWTQILFEIRPSSRCAELFLNGKKFREEKDSAFGSINNSKRCWTICLGHKSTENLTNFRYDLGNVFLFDKIDFRENFLAEFLFSLGADRWNFFSESHRQIQRSMSIFFFHRISRVVPSISFGKFHDDFEKNFQLLRRSIVGSFSVTNPWTFFLFNSTGAETPNENEKSRLAKLFPFFSGAANFDENFLRTSTVELDLPSKISVDSSSNFLNASEPIGAVLNFIFFFAKIVENPNEQNSIVAENFIEIILDSIWKMKTFYERFSTVDAHRILSKIFQTEQFDKIFSRTIFDKFLDRTTSNERQKLFDVDFLRIFIVEPKIFRNQNQFFAEVFTTLSFLLSEHRNAKFYAVNRILFQRRVDFRSIFFSVEQILDDESTQIVLDGEFVKNFIEIVEAAMKNDFQHLKTLFSFLYSIHPTEKTYATFDAEHFFFVFPRSVAENSKNLQRKTQHDVELLTAGILEILKNFSINATDRLFKQLIEENVFQIELLVVLLIDSSIVKRVQTLEFIDVFLKRLDNDKVQQLILNDTHIVMANQIYRRLAENQNLESLIKTSLSIALQRPIKLNFNQKFVSNSFIANSRLKSIDMNIHFASLSSFSFNEQIDKDDNLFPVVASSNVCPRSQIGLTLLLSLIEKSQSSLLLQIVNEIIEKSSDENRQFLVGINLTHVLLNTLSTIVSTKNDELFLLVVRCFNSLILCEWNSKNSQEISFVSILNTMISMIERENLDEEKDSFNNQFRLAVQKIVSSMFVTIIDSIEKPSNNDDSLNNVNPIDMAERFRRFVQLTFDSILLFHGEPVFTEKLTSRLLDLCLLSMAYAVEKRTSNSTQRNSWPSVMLKLTDFLRKISQKLLIVALEPEKQNFFFRIEIVHTLLEQPNYRKIIEYLLNNENTFNNVLIYFLKLFNTKPTRLDVELWSKNKFFELSNKSFDSGNISLNFSNKIKSPSVSNGEDSSSNTINVTLKPHDSLSTEFLCSDDDNFSTVLGPQRSPSASSVSSEAASIIGNSSMFNYKKILHSFHETFNAFRSWTIFTEQYQMIFIKTTTTNENEDHPSKMFIETKQREFNVQLQQQIVTLEKQNDVQQKSSEEIFHKSTLTTIINRAKDLTQKVVHRQGLVRKEYLEYLRSMQSIDGRVKFSWHQLIDRLTHEYGIWFEPTSCPKFWELDPTENSQRERRRLQRSFCFMEKKFFQNPIPQEKIVEPTLSYLFDSRHNSTSNISNVLKENEKLLVSALCINVTPNAEIDGELVVGSEQVYFLAEEQYSMSMKNQTINTSIASIGYSPHAFNETLNSFSFLIKDVYEIFKRRYMLKDVAIELFLTNGVTRMIALKKNQDRDNIYRILTKQISLLNTHENKLSKVQSNWRYGTITNFEYLMQLNTMAGRSYLDLMQYPVYPYIVANYETDVLDLRQSSNYRNLAKPIAVQHPDKEEKFIETYQALQDSYQIALSNEQDSDSPSANILPFGPQSKPYHFASLYSNSGVVLHFMVRMLPYTRMFLEYQDNHFDCADRTFHDVKTSYWLSSYESTSDFKELIPEFYYLHEFLVNKQGFNFGFRQNGERVSDVTLPAWSKKDARLYVYALRQALESEYVTNHLHQWIDLIFGHKQTGKPALDAVNIYHAACYYGFPIESFDDPLTQKAYQGIVRTYGQVPIKLFDQPHPSVSSNHPILGYDRRFFERAKLESLLPRESIHHQIVGVRWGDFVGSYDLPSPEYVSASERSIQVTSFAMSSNGAIVMGLPASTMIVQNDDGIFESSRRFGQSDLTYSLTSSSSSQNVNVTSALDSMIALKWNTTDGIIRCRWLKQSKIWHNFIVPIDDQDRITFCASIDCRLLFIGKASGLIEIYAIRRNRLLVEGIELVERYLPFIAHRSSITYLYVNRQFSLLLSASADGMLTLWDTNRLCYVRTYKQDDQSIYYLTSSETSGDIAYLSSSGSKWHLTYLTCNCDLVQLLTFSEKLNCLCFTCAPEGTCVNLLLGGFGNGIISMWSTWDLTLLRQIQFTQLDAKPILALCISKTDRRRLLVADGDRRVHTIESRVPLSTNGQTTSQFLFLS